MATRQPDPQADPPPAAANTADRPQVVEELSWDQFEGEFDWEQGEHVSLIGPTGRGKTTLAGNILERRRLVVAMDFKGDDPGLKRWGWETSESWPIEDEAERLKGRIETRPSGEKVRIVDPIRVRLAPQVRTREDRAKAAQTFADCFDDVFELGGWSVYVDELRIACSRKFDLADHIEDLMVHARSRGVSMVNSTQSPSWVPKLTYDQATHLFIWPVRDYSGLERVEEISGFGRQLRDILRGMDKHDVLYVKPPDAVFITRAPAPKEQDEPEQSTRGVVPTPEEHDAPPHPRGGGFRRRAWG